MLAGFRLSNIFRDNPLAIAVSAKYLDATRLKLRELWIAFFLLFAHRGLQIIPPHRRCPMLDLGIFGPPDFPARKLQLPPRTQADQFSGNRLA